MLEGIYMKSAKEMFEELGYELDEQEDYLVYWKVAKKQRVNFYHNQNEIQIEFNLSYKTVEKRELLDDTPGIIIMQELKAINKQIEELGWS